MLLGRPADHEARGPVWEQLESYNDSKNYEAPRYTIRLGRRETYKCECVEVKVQTWTLSDRK